MKYLVAIDEGTTSTRAMLYDVKKKAFVAQKSLPVKQYYPHPGYVEEDADEIYANTLAVLTEMLEKADSPADVGGIGITNQRETVILWNKKTGKPVYKAIVWQCRRTAKFCEEIPAETVEKIREKTGLVVDAYFSATKIKWALDNVPAAKKLLEEHNLCAGTVDSYLIYKLTGNFCTDYTNASRSMLFNIHTLSYDKELLDYFGIPEEILPKVLSSTAVYGNFRFRGNDIPVAGVLGDQQAALFGQNCFTVGSGKITYGTGMFMLFNTGDVPAVSTCKMVTTIGYSVGDKITYALEGSVFNAGSAVQWLRDGLHLFNDSKETEALALSVKSTDGVYVIPAFTGIGAPYWKSDATGLITGITRGTTTAHITRAVLESMAYSARNLADCMTEDSGFALTEIRADGGASANGFLMQFSSDVLGVKIDRPVERESTALGAVYACGIALGLFTQEELVNYRKSDKIFKPTKDRESVEKLYDGYLKAVKRCLL